MALLALGGGGTCGDGSNVYAIYVIIAKKKDRSSKTLSSIPLPMVLLQLM